MTDHHALARFYAPDAAPGADRAELPADEAHHLTRVLRLEVGVEVAVFNGRGGEWAGRVAGIDRTAVSVALERPVEPVAEPPVQITLAVGVLKGDQMDQVVRDATALGAQAIAPLASAHVTVPPRAWASGRIVDRWRRVAVAAAKQSGRAVVPDVRPIAAFDDVLAAAGTDLVLIAVEPAARGIADADLTLRPRAALALVGPEGGWSPDELARAAAHGARAVRLGPRRLRAELAPAVLLSSLWTQWGW